MFDYSDYESADVASSNIEDEFKELLEEAYGPIHIGELTYSVAHVWKAVDPVAYRIALSDFEDDFVEEED